MCQNYWHRAQRDATTARLRRALTGDSLERTRAARSRHRAQRDATTTRRSRVAKHVSFHSRGSANGCAKTTGIARSAMQLQRGYAAPSLQILLSERATARFNYTRLRRDTHALRATHARFARLINL